MKAICYKNTKTILPNWSETEKLHEKMKYGYAYENADYFVHFYGADYGIMSIESGLTVV